MTNVNDSMYMKGGNSDAEKAAYKLGWEAASTPCEELKALRELKEINEVLLTSAADSLEDCQQRISELEREKERITKLLETQFFHEYNDSYQKGLWQQFKTENNL